MNPKQIWQQKLSTHFTPLCCKCYVNMFSYVFTLHFQIPTLKVKIQTLNYLSIRRLSGKAHLTLYIKKTINSKSFIENIKSRGIDLQTNFQGDSLELDVLNMLHNNQRTN